MSNLANIHIKTLKYINKNSKSLILNCGYGNMIPSREHSRYKY